MRTQYDRLIEDYVPCAPEPRPIPDGAPCACECMDLQLDELAREWHGIPSIDHGMGLCQIDVDGLSKGAAESVAAIWTERGLHAWAGEENGKWWVAAELHYDPPRPW